MTSRVPRGMTSRVPRGMTSRVPREMISRVNRGMISRVNRGMIRDVPVISNSSLHQYRETRLSHKPIINNSSMSIMIRSCHRQTSFFSHLKTGAKMNRICSDLQSQIWRQDSLPKRLLLRTAL